MRSLRAARFTMLAVVPHALAALTACGGASDELGQSNDELALSGTLTDPPIAATVAAPPPPPIVNGTLTTVPSWVVMVEIEKPDVIGVCSAWVLNEHWLLTAAHCVQGVTNGAVVRVSRADRPGSLVQEYDGPGKYFANPLFTGAAAHDVGLVHLENEGLSIDRTGVAKMYSDTRRPWADASLPRAISAVGWGFSIPDPNNPAGCTGGGGLLRTTGSMSVDVSSATTSVVTSPVGASFPCTGDSGAPWLLERGDATDGTDFFGFAVHSRRAGSPVKGQAAPLDDNRAFIESTMKTAATTDRYGLGCEESTFGGFKFRHCDMVSRGWAQLRALGKCMQMTSPTPGAAVTLVTCNQSVFAQVWSLVPSGQILNAQNPNLCLETLHFGVGNTNPHVATCDLHSTAQRFGNGAQGQLPLGIDFHQCVTAAPDPGNAAAAPAPTTKMATLAAAPASATTATLATAAPSTSGLVASGLPCVTLSCLPKVVTKDCDGSATQNWQWGTF